MSASSTPSVSVDEVVGSTNLSYLQKVVDMSYLQKVVDKHIKKSIKSTPAPSTSAPVPAPSNHITVNVSSLAPRSTPSNIVFPPPFPSFPASSPLPLPTFNPPSFPTPSASTPSTSSSVWSKLDSNFDIINKHENSIRQMVQSGESIPDLFLTKLDPSGIEMLRSFFKESREDNLVNPDPQRRSVRVNYGTKKDLPANVQTHRTSIEMKCTATDQKGPVYHLKCYDMFIKKLKKLPSDLIRHVVLAGGSPLFHITQMGWLSDHDLFIVDTTDPERVLERLLYHFREILDISFIVRTENSVTLRTNLGTIQIVLRAYKSPAEVILGFDIGPSACCYVPFTDTYYVTPRAYYSIKHATIHVDIERMSETYNQRLVKYAHKGFTIYIPTPLQIRHFDEAHRFVANLKGYSFIAPFVIKKTQERLNQSLSGLLAGLLFGPKTFRNIFKHFSCDYCQISDAALKETGYSSKSGNSKKARSGVRLIKSNQNKVVGYGFNPFGMSKLSLVFHLDPKDVETGYWRETKPEEVQFPDLEFMSKNPGTQHTGSFNPVNMTWDKWISTELKISDFDDPDPVPAPVVSASSSVEDFVTESGVRLTTKDIERLRALLC